MARDVTFTVAKAVEEDWLRIAGSPDDDEPYSPFTRWFQYIEGDAQDIVRLDGSSWTRVDHPDNVPIR